MSNTYNTESNRHAVEEHDNRSKRRVTLGRVIGASVTALLVSGFFLVVLDFAARLFFQDTAFSKWYLIAAAISAVVVFLLVVFPANRPYKGAKHVVRTLLLITLPLAIFLAATIWDVQGFMMYQTSYWNEDDVRTIETKHDIEAITIHDENGSLYKGWLWQKEEGKAGLIIYFGGNAEYASTSVLSHAEDAELAAVLAGYNFLMIDYPGYGQSEGEPSEEAIYRMALQLWEQIAERDDVDPEKLVIAGWSLGSGTAARLAAEKSAQGLILMAPFYNGASLVNDYSKAFSEGSLKADIFGPNHVLLRNKYRSDLYAEQIDIPVLLIAAKQDSVIPPYQARALSEKYRGATYIEVEGSHSAPYFGHQANSAIQTFLKEINE